MVARSMIRGRADAPRPQTGLALPGRVLELRRWPVKSLAGERIAASRLDGRGFAGDRTDALFELRPDGTTLRRLTARQAPRMLLWSAAYASLPDDGVRVEAPPSSTLTAPDGRTFSSDDPEIAVALSDDLGRRVEIRRDVGGQQDLPRSLLITTEASRLALEGLLGRGIDVRRFRPNVHVELAGVEPFAEERLTGARARIGEVELELLHPCQRCVIPTRHPDSTEKWPELLRFLARERALLFGLNARALGSGRVAEGDRVELLT